MSDTRPLEGKRILVLEDDFYLAKDEKALLEQAGAEVVGPFGSAQAGKPLPVGERIDGAVVDLNLGQGPSFDLAWALSARGIPFLFVTGYAAGVIPASLAHVGLIEKPINERDFVGAVVRLFDASSAPRATD